MPCEQQLATNDALHRSGNIVGGGWVGGWGYTCRFYIVSKIRDVRSRLQGTMHNNIRFVVGAGIGTSHFLCSLHMTVQVHVCGGG